MFQVKKVGLITSTILLSSMINLVPFEEAAADQVCFDQFTPGNVTFTQFTRIDETDPPVGGYPPCPNLATTFLGNSDIFGSGLFLPGYYEEGHNIPGFASVVISHWVGKTNVVDFDFDLELARAITNKATVQLSNNSDISQWQGPLNFTHIGDYFINNGDFIKSSGSGTSDVSIDFLSTQRVNPLGPIPLIRVAEGTLLFSGENTKIQFSDISVASGATLSFGGLRGGRLISSNSINNKGIIKAENGSSLSIGTVEVTSEGIFLAADNSTIIMESVSISNSRLDTEGTGIITASVSEFNNITNDGLLRLVGNVLTRNKFSGKIINNGTIRDSSAILEIDNNGVTLEGGGVFEVESSSLGGTAFLSGGTLTNMGNTITGIGTSARLNGGKIINQAIIEAKDAHQFTIASDILSNDTTGIIRAATGGTLVLSGLTDNQGSFEVQEASTIKILQNDFETSGQVTVNETGDFTVRGVSDIGTFYTTYNQTAGETKINGMLTANEININGGILSGTGLINGNLNITNGGILQPGNSPGTLTIDGDFLMETGSTLNLEIAGISIGEFDRLFVSGELNLFGDIFFQLNNGVSPDLFEQVFNISDFFQIYDPITSTSTPYTSFDIFTGASYFAQYEGSLFDVIFNQDIGTFFVDNAPSIPQIGVPEPGLNSLFILGTIGGFLLHRRKRRNL